MDKIKISFILPNIEISGGVRAVFELANHLCQRGYEVNVIYPLFPSRDGKRFYKGIASGLLSILSNLKQGVTVGWFDLKAKLIRVQFLSEYFIPDSDVIIATWWKTAYVVKHCNSNKGIQLYLIQHYEIWGGPQKAVDVSYKLGLMNIVNSSWLKKILEGLGAKVDALIPHAPDFEHFYPEKKRSDNSPIRILMAYRNIKWKGIDDGIKAFEIVREQYRNVKLVMFGPRVGTNVPPHVEFHESPSNNTLRGIYNSCDIFLFSSHVEGFGMPPMEAMACKCAVVTTNVGAVPDYTIANVTALVSPPHSPELLAKELFKLVTDNNLRSRIAEAGYEHMIKYFGWRKATDSLEQLFLRTLQEKQ